MWSACKHGAKAETDEENSPERAEKRDKLCVEGFAAGATGGAEYCAGDSGAGKTDCELVGGDAGHGGTDVG